MFSGDIERDQLPEIVQPHWENFTYKNMNLVTYDEE